MNKSAAPGAAMAALSDMDRHFTEVSSVYRYVRTTDREPIDLIARELEDLPQPKGVDIGCGAGRYDLLMFKTIPGLYLTCVDANQAMLEKTHDLLAANRIEAFATRQATAEALELEAGAYDFVTSFNAVHHFDLRRFLKKMSDALAAHGHLFVYTRLPEQNARSIWGRYFPGFTETETRLFALSEIQQAIEDTAGLRFVGATRLRYQRRSTLERLVEQARGRHYSTFSLYDPEVFEKALAEFRRKVQSRFSDAVEWQDENVLIHALRGDE